jgi:ankyrin repeat protein
MGWTPLIFAARGGHDEVLSMLIAKGADADQVTHEGASALYVGALWGYEEVVAQLLRAGADPDGSANAACSENEAKPNVPLVAAASGGHLGIVHQLLSAGASVDLADGDGRTALVAARAARHRAVSAALVKAGAQDGATTARYAQSSSHKPCPHGSAGAVRHTQSAHHAAWLRQARAVRSARRVGV